MVTFLIGFLSGAGDGVTHYLQTTGAPDLVDLVAAVAVSAWVGVAAYALGSRCSGPHAA